jgi:putative endonuclease
MAIVVSPEQCASASGKSICSPGAPVEVKARAGLLEASESIGRRQGEPISRGATAFLQRHPSLGKLELRFEVVLIVPGHWPRHIASAWRDDTRP